MSTSASEGWLAAVCCVAVLACGCNLAPRYAVPETPASPAYKEASDGTVWKPAQPGDAQARGKWWELFGDAKLDEFEDRLSSSNQNIAAAAAAFLAARAVVTQARSQYFPSVAATPSVTRSHISATPFGTSANNSFTEYSLAFDASWMPDFWGKTSDAVAANRFAAQASAADLESVRLSAHIELAVDYYQLRAQDALVVLLDSAAVADREALSLNEVLQKAGLTSDQAVAQEEVRLQTAQAQAVNAGILRAQYEHAIATLLGQPASTFSIAVEPFEAPKLSVPIGVPSDLLERRPDIASAERGAAQANAQIGIARAAYFPSMTLGASGGFESFAAATWLTWPSRFWSLGASAGETLFDAGLRKATVSQFKAVYEETAANYRQTVLAAFEQVEDDLSSVSLSAQDVQHQNAAVEAGRRNFEETEARCKAGLAPYLDVLVADNSLLALEQAALTYKLQQVISGVRLIEALGGGWDRSQLPKPKELR